MASQTYTKEPVGKMVMFLLPSLKLKERNHKGQSFEERIHHFLLKNFEGYTAAAGNIFGYWKNHQGREFYGEHKEYKVSVGSHPKIEKLEAFIAELAAEMKEQSVYIEIGQEGWLLYPKELDE